MKTPDLELAKKAVRCWGSVSCVEHARPIIETLSLRLQQYSRGSRAIPELADAIASALIAMAQIERLVDPFDLALRIAQQELGLRDCLDGHFGKEA